MAGAAHMGPLISGVLGEDTPVGEHAEDEERYCYCNGISNGVMIGCDNEVNKGDRESGLGRDIPRKTAGAVVLQHRGRESTYILEYHPLISFRSPFSSNFPRIARPNGSTSSVLASWSRLMVHGTAIIASRV